MNNLLQLLAGVVVNQTKRQVEGQKEAAEVTSAGGQNHKEGTVPSDYGKF